MPADPGTTPAERARVDWRELAEQQEGVIARRQLVAGTLIKNEGITVIGLVPPGHKVATRAIAAA